MSNIFSLSDSEYKRQIDPIGHYIEQCALFLHKSTNRPLQECKDFAHKQAKANLNDPNVIYFERQQNNDRLKQENKLTKYIYRLINEKSILAPSFTVYINPKIRKSPIVDFIDNNVKRRSVAKKASHKAKAAGDLVTYVIKDNEQANMKTYNNSLSGAFATEGSFLHNPTSHSTLTSTTRSVSSLGNALNERTIAGNRHYFNPQVTLNNIIVITTLTNREIFAKCIEAFNLHIPTYQDVIDCIKRSTQLYWIDNKAFNPIEKFIYKLDDIDRAAVVYTGDLFHIRKHNPEVVRAMLLDLSLKVTDENDYSESDVYKFDESIINFGHQICSDDVKGYGKDYKKMSENGVLQKLVPTCKHITEAMQRFELLLKTMFTSLSIPSSVSYLPNMVRRSVVLSDTDSTIFSVDEFVNWHYGKIWFSSESYAFASSVAFIATECISHALKILSSNIGVSEDRLTTLTMKPEFSFPVFAMTSVAKHYYANRTVQEGNVFKKPDYEIKGVHLKSSATPPALMKKAKTMMEFITDSIMDNKKISLVSILTEIANIEREIKNSLIKGESKYFKSSKIKNKEAYSGPEKQTPFIHHELWEQVFAPKYTTMGPPPYSTLKIPTILDSKLAVKNWLDNIADKELSSRMASWLIEYGKKDLPTMYINSDYLSSFGIPIEVMPIIDIKRIILDLTNVFRIIAESLGYFAKPGMLISELGF